MFTCSSLAKAALIHSGKSLIFQNELFSYWDLEKFDFIFKEPDKLFFFLQTFFSASFQHNQIQIETPCWANK